MLSCQGSRMFCLAFEAFLPVALSTEMLDYLHQTKGLGKVAVSPP